MSNVERASETSDEQLEDCSLVAPSPRCLFSPSRTELLANLAGPMERVGMSPAEWFDVVDAGRESKS